MNGTTSATTQPTSEYFRALPGAGNLSDADLWEHYRALGLSPEQAQLHVLRRRSGRQAVADNPPPRPKVTSPEEAVLLGASRTITSGFADELVGALDALRGPEPHGLAQRLFGTLAGKPAGQFFDAARYRQTRDQIRERQSQALAEHPGVSLGAGFLGYQANPLNYLVGPATRAMGAVTKGATYGASLGAAQGVGEGTSGPDRVAQALRDAALGAAIGGVGGVASKLWRAVFQSAPAKITEAAVRAQLAKLKFSTEQADQAVAIWRQGGLLPGGTPKRLPIPPAPPPPPTVRPGETITQTSPRGFEVTGTRATPPVPTAPTLAEMQGLPTQSMGRGNTLPWYPRGGQAEQGMAPFPATSAPAGAPPSQLGTFLNYLKQAATPQDALARLGTIRDLGIPVGPEEQTQVLQLLFGARR